MNNLRLFARGYAKAAISDEQKAAVKKALRSLSKPSVKRPTAPGPLFSFFLKEKYASLAGEGAKDKMKEAGRIWSSLPDFEKEPYIQKRNAMMEKYKMDLRAYKENQSPEDAKLEKRVNQLKRQLRPPVDPNRPTRPLNPFFQFSVDLRRSKENQIKFIGQDLSHMKAPESSRLIKATWDGLPEELKEQYKQQYEKGYQQYKNQLAEYQKSS